MKRKLITLSLFLTALAVGVTNVSAQFNIKFPDIKIKKPEKPDIKDTTKDTTKTTENVKTSKSNFLYPQQRPTNVPILMKDSIYIQARTHDEYWKFPKESNYSSWVPQIRFSQFYNNEKELHYTVEYLNTDGSLWFSEKLESRGRNADETVLYESPSSTEVLDTKSTASAGVFGFKITNADTKEVLYQGKFKVGKYSRANRPEEKNKAGFYTENDWILPFAMLGFHFSGFEIGGFPALVSVWLKGDVSGSELEGRIFYKGRQIASTKTDGGVNSREDRYADSAPAFDSNKMWKHWQFQWNNFLVDNNGTFNRDEYKNAFYADKNPGDYTVKIYLSGTQIRELSFAVGADGRFVAPSWSSQIPMPYYRLILPAKVLGTEKWDTAAWKTDAFYGNPLTGFEIK
jgi:hypothetical protein